MDLGTEAVIERKRVKFYRDGGSRKITPPKAWLSRLGMDNALEGELILTDDGIILRPVRKATRPDSIEDEPEFASFLTFLAKRALGHPETLTDAASLRDRDADLVVR